MKSTYCYKTWIDIKRERIDINKKLHDKRIDKRIEKITEEESFEYGLLAIVQYILDIVKGDIENDELIDLLQNKAQLSYTFALTDPIAKMVQDAIEREANNI